jgi:LacI family transcriptional regulator
MGYITNGAARHTEVSSIGLIIRTRPGDAPDNNYFYAPVLSGIEAFCRKRDINLFYAHMPVDDENRPLQPPRLLKDRHTDGLLLVGAVLDRATVKLLQRQEVPVVLVDAYDAEEVGINHGHFDAVVTDNEAGAYQATRYLIDHGHRHIAIIGSQPHAYPSIQERRAGYLKAMAESELEPRFVDCPLHPDDAVPATLAFLQNEGDGVTAFFACNDEIAIAVMRALQEQGRRVPQELSVIGFDNIRLAHLVTPALTTMRVDKMGMGRLAAQLLADRIERPDMGLVRAVIRPSLLERKSVATV